MYKRIKLLIILVCSIPIMVSTALMAWAQAQDRAPDAEPLTWHLEGYPDWAGAWERRETIQWPGWENAPLTEEGWRVFEKGQALQKIGNQGGDPTWNCIAPGMPRIMTGVLPMEYIVLPHVTLIYQEYQMQVRRVYTDGRDWPEYVEPSMNGYSIGEWKDSDNDGEFDSLYIETRAIAGKRSYGSNGLPLSPKNDTITYEKIYLDPDNSDIILNDFTTEDGYLTEPWTVTRTLHRNREPVAWTHYVCQEDNRYIMINDEFYMLNFNRTMLMPTRPDQPPPVYYQAD